MPHRCMDCKNILESGSLDLKQGCPVCGCKKFQYVRPPKKGTRPAPSTVIEYVSMSPPEKAAPPAEAPKEPPVFAKPETAPEGEAFRESFRIESVRIVEPGTYDINLPVLMSRKELVMSKEEGDYYVDLKSALRPVRKKKRN